MRKNRSGRVICESFGNWKKRVLKENEFKLGTWHEKYPQAKGFKFNGRTWEPDEDEDKPSLNVKCRK